MAKYRHIFINGNVTTDRFKSPRRGSDNAIIPRRARAAHSRKLLQQFQKIWSDKIATDAERTAESIPSNNGTYVQFTSAINFDLITKSLESISNGIRLLNIQEEIVDEQKQMKALVFIPHGKENYFVKKIEKYRTEYFGNTLNPKNDKLVRSIEDITLSLLEGLWTDNKTLIPNEIGKWCEVWLNIKEEEIENNIRIFIETLSEIKIASKPNYIVFPERAVVLINANRQQLVE
jgi:hypothetical protein